MDAKAKPLTLTIRFDPQAMNAKNVGEMTKQSLESDPDNTGPVSITYKQEDSDRQ